jgi:hypothetical protein
MADSYTFAGPHPESLASGRPLALGDTDISGVNPDDPHDKFLIDEGWLVNASPEPDQLSGDALNERARDLNIKGRSQMGVDELRAAVKQAEKEQS